MKNLILLLCAVVPAVLAQDTKTNGNDVPVWAAEWRVTGMIRQGSNAQASMERTGVRSRFVKPGDRLPGDVAVLEVNYAERSVTINNGKENAVIYAASVMVAPLPPPKVAGMPQQQRQGGNNNQGQWPNPPQRTTAMRDGNGRWFVVTPDGRSTDMQAQAERRGGVQAAMDHTKEHLDRETNPERMEYYKEQMRAFKAMRDAGQR